MSEALARDLIVVSGLSGSGKSVSLQALEDAGFYCVDNLPAPLLGTLCAAFAALPDSESPKGAAVGIDSRNQAFLRDLSTALDALTGQGIAFRLLYLESDPDSVLRRYHETRRRHPLADSGQDLSDSIACERALLEPIRARAAKCIDTTLTTPHELRRLVRDFAGGEAGDETQFLFESFGYKYGLPREADFVFDVRCLPNPYWHAPLRELTGHEREVIEFLESQPQVAAMRSAIGELLGAWLPVFAREGRSRVTIAIGCTGGQHRSVYLANALAADLKAKKLATETHHRELAK